MVHMEMVDVSTEEGNEKSIFVFRKIRRFPGHDSLAEQDLRGSLHPGRRRDPSYGMDADTLGVSAGDSITMEKEDGSSSQEVQVMGV